MQYKLTITIPTYNRPIHLVEQVKRVYSQMKDTVSLTILDNNSDSYDIYNIIPINILNDKRVEVIKNKINVGADANFCKAFELCETQWLWILADDDYIKPNAIENLLKLIRGLDNVTYIIMNSSADYYTNDFREFCYNKEEKYHFTWISNNIYNINHLNKCVIYAYQNIITMSAPFGMMLNYLQNNAKVKCLFVKLNLIEYSYPYQWNEILFLKRFPLIAINIKSEMKRCFNLGLGKNFSICSFGTLHRATYKYNIKFREIIEVYKSIGYYYGRTNLFTLFCVKHTLLLLICIFSKSLYKYVMTNYANHPLQIHPNE